MPKTVADGLWEMLVSAGARRCYGIVGDALNPVVDAMRRNGSVDFVHVRHEEYGVFAAVAEAKLTGNPVAVCGTAGPGAVHLINGLLDARKERVPVIVLAGDTEFDLLDSETVEELNPYQFFSSAAVYIGRLVNPRQLRNLVTSAVTAAVTQGGPAVVALPGEVAAAGAPEGRFELRLPRPVRAAARADDLTAMAAMINEAGTVAIFGDNGCELAQAEVRALAGKLSAPVGYSLKGKQFLEHDNPNAVGMTGLLGYGGCHDAINHADVLLMLGTDFPFSTFLPHKNVRIIQVDHDPGRLGRRVPVDLAVAGDVHATLTALLPLVDPKPEEGLLNHCIEKTERFHGKMRNYTEKGPHIKPIRPEYLAAILSKLADQDALSFADTGTPVIWAARHIRYGPRRRLFGSFSWASMANASPNAFGAAGLSRPADDRAVRRRRVRHARPWRPAHPGRAPRPGRAHRAEQQRARLREDRAGGGGPCAVRHRSRQSQLRGRRRGDGREGDQNRGAGRRGFRAPGGLGPCRGARRGRCPRRSVRPSGARARAGGNGWGLHTLRRQASLCRPSRRCNRDRHAQRSAGLSLRSQASRYPRTRTTARLRYPDQKIFPQGSRTSSRKYLST
jgi:pyruvate dehydrogenase (quinone)